MDSKSVLKKALSLLLVGMIALSLLAVPKVDTYAKSSYKTTVAKFLKAMKNKKYKTAKKYAKKMKTKKDTSLKKMSKEQKAAYKKVIKSFKFESGFSRSSNSLDSYYLADLDKDRKPELLVKIGDCEAAYRTKVYTYKDGAAVLVGQMGSGHTEYIPYPGKGVVQGWGHMGATWFSLLYMKNGKLATKAYGGQSNTTNLVFPSNGMYGHTKYSGGKYVLDLKDLK